MSDERDLRTAILMALKTGRQPGEIANFLRLPRATVYRVKERFDSNKTVARKPQDRSDVKKRNPDFLKKLQDLINEDPSQSMRILSQKMEVGVATISQAIHENLRYKSCVLKMRQGLSDVQKAKGLDKASILLSKLKHWSVGRIRFFSDEIFFSVEQSVNRRNDRYLAHDPDDVPIAAVAKNLHILCSFLFFM